MGGDDAVAINITIGNDTGSNILSLFAADLDDLGCDRQTYRGIMGEISPYSPPMGFAEGIKSWLRCSSYEEIKVLSPVGLFEAAIVNPVVLGQNQLRLSVMV